MTNQKLAPFAIVIGLAIVLQVALIGLDCSQTPAKVAKSFADAYYYLDADMEKYLCKALQDEGNVVENYLYDKQYQAEQRGLPPKYLRHKLIHTHLELVETGDDYAVVNLTGTSRVCIYPVFMLVGKLFRIGQDYEIDETIELVKENGRWRVCDSSFDL